MCAKDNTAPAPEDVHSEPGEKEERDEIRPRITGEAAERVRAYAELHGISMAEAAEKMILVASGATDIGELVTSMDVKLERVLQELQAPGVGAPVDDNGIVADGAVRAKIDYNNLSWSHEEPIERDEARFDDSDVLKHTPRTRVPVIRGILLDEKKKTLTEGQLREMMMDVFGCARATADSYIQTGEHRSWYPHPEMELNQDTELFEHLQEILSESATPRNEKRIQQFRSLEDLFSGETVEYEGEQRAVWDPSSEYHLDERLFNGKIRQMVWKLREYVLEHPRSGKGKLLLTRALAYAHERGDFTEEEADEIRTELEEQGVELPSGTWW